MKRRHLSLIVISVLAVHVVFFWLVADKKVLPKKSYVAPANFSGREQTRIDEQSGETIRYREFTVSTLLAEPRSQGSRKQ